MNKSLENLCELGATTTQQSSANQFYPLRSHRVGYVLIFLQRTMTNCTCDRIGNRKRWHTQHQHGRASIHTYIVPISPSIQNAIHRLNRCGIWDANLTTMTTNFNYERTGSGVNVGVRYTQHQHEHGRASISTQYQSIHPSHMLPFFLQCDWFLPYIHIHMQRALCRLLQIRIEHYTYRTLFHIKKKKQCKICSINEKIDWLRNLSVHTSHLLHIKCPKFRP